MTRASLCAIAVLALGCGTADPSKVASISVAPMVASVEMGHSQQFTAAAFDKAGDLVPGVKLNWSTNNVSVAQVDQTGNVSALLPGVAEITASINGISSPAVSLVIVAKAGAPSAPTEVVAEPGVDSVKVTWKANPAGEGVGSYTVLSATAPWSTWAATLPDAATKSGLACCSVTLNGLKIGAEHFFSVSATNPIAEGPQSTPLARATPTAVGLRWSKKADMPTPRYDLGVAVLDRKIYAVGGNSGSLLGTLEVYDPSSDTWATKASMPTARAALAVAAVNGKIYAIGGRSTFNLNEPLSTVTEEYDPVTDLWAQKAPLPITANHSCGRTAGAAVNGMIYVWQGSCSSPADVVLYQYEAAANIWTSKSAVPWQLIYRHQLVTLGNHLFVFNESGGREGAPIAEYDAVSGIWTNRAPLRDPQNLGNAADWSVLGATAQTLFGFGAQSASGDGKWTSVARYFDSAKNAWLPTTALSSPRAAFATASIDNAIYALGGTLRADFTGANSVPVATLEIGVELTR